LLRRAVTETGRLQNGSLAALAALAALAVLPQRPAVKGKQMKSAATATGKQMKTMMVMRQAAAARSENLSACRRRTRL